MRYTGPYRPQRAMASLSTPKSRLRRNIGIGCFISVVASLLVYAVVTGGDLDSELPDWLTWTSFVLMVLGATFVAVSIEARQDVDSAAKNALDAIFKEANPTRPIDYDASSQPIFGSTATPVESSEVITEEPRPELAEVRKILEEQLGKILKEQRREDVRMQWFFFFLGAAVGLLTQVFL